MNSELLSSKSAAMKAGHMFYYIGPCVRGHDMPRYVSRGRCVTCCREDTAAIRSATSDRINKQRREHYAANREKFKEASAAKRKRPATKALKAFHEGKRRARRHNATPTWLTPEQHAEIKAVYVEAARLTQATGVRHEVDHEVPLQGENVCGLHVPWNLQILTRVENIRKKNKVII